MYVCMYVCVYIYIYYGKYDYIMNNIFFLIYNFEIIFKK